jgi:hypothetical protein
MTQCPWFDHDVDPDPAGLGLAVGVVGMCLICSLQYVVTRTTPSYKLVRDGAGSASTIFALSKVSEVHDYRSLFSAKGVKKALVELGVPKQHLK